MPDIYGEKLSSPIVTIPLTALDIARAINRAKKEYGEPVAFFKSHQPYTYLCPQGNIGLQI